MKFFAATIQRQVLLKCIWLILGLVFLNTAQAQLNRPVQYNTNTESVSVPANFWQRLNSSLKPTSSNSISLGDSNKFFSAIYLATNGVVLVDGSGTNTFNVGVPYTLASNINFILPASHGSAGQVLSTDANGILSWINQSGGGGGGISNALLGHMIRYVDGTTGDDSNTNKPYKTLTAAKNAATEGMTIIVFPGTYTNENNLLKNGVNWHGVGATVSYYHGEATLGIGIFDDRGIGAITSNITGDWNFGYGVVVTNYDTAGTDPYPYTTNAANILGMLTITNPASRISFKAHDIKLTSANLVYALYQTDGYLTATFDNIIDTLFTNSVFIGQDSGMTDIYVASHANGVWWARGEQYIKGDSITVQNYCFYGDHPTGFTGKANAWINVDFLHNYGYSGTNSYSISASPIYFAGSGTSTNWKSWFGIKEADTIAAGIQSSAFGVYANVAYGNHYIYAEKLNGPVGITTSASGNLWATIQKITATSREALFVSKAAGSSTGIVDLTFQTIESPKVRAVYVSDGTITLNDGIIIQTNGYGLVHDGGKTFLNNVRIKTDSVNLASNIPVVISATGLVMNASSLMAPAAADSISATTAQTNKVYNGLVINRPINANVTTHGGIVTWDNGTPTISRIDLGASPSAGQALVVHSVSGLQTIWTNATVSGGGGGAGSMPFDLTQFTTNGTVTVKDGALMTNTVHKGSLTMSSGNINLWDGATIGHLNVGLVFSDALSEIYPSAPNIDLGASQKFGNIYSDSFVSVAGISSLSNLIVGGNASGKLMIAATNLASSTSNSAVIVSNCLVNVPSNTVHTASIALVGAAVTTGVSNTVHPKWIINNLPAVGGMAQTLQFISRTNTETGVNAATLGQNGAFTTLGIITAGSDFKTSGGNGSYEINGRLTIGASSDGVVFLRNSTATDFSRLTFGTGLGATNVSFFKVPKTNYLSVVSAGSESNIWFGVGTTNNTARLTIDSTLTTNSLLSLRNEGIEKVSFGTNGTITLATNASLAFQSGANQRAGNATLVGGTVTVNNGSVTANTIVMLTRKTSGGTIGYGITYTVSAGTSFTITSDNVLDTSTFSYLLIEVP